MKAILGRGNKMDRNSALIASVLLLMASESDVAAAKAAAAISRDRSCATLTIRHSTSALITEEVLEAMCSYFDAENSEKWSVTYGFRPTRFRSRVPLDVYSASMAKSKRGFDVRVVDVIIVTPRSPSRMQMVVDFYEMPSGTLAGFSRKEGFEFKGDELVWVNEGSWLCNSCGHRGRFSLNRSIGEEDS
jgi:hypothetical protein